MAHHGPHIEEAPIPQYGGGPQSGYAPTAVSLDVGHGPREWQPRGRGRTRKPQLNSPLFKPVCKPDAVKRSEKGKTEATKRTVICRVRRGHCTLKRLSEMSETVVVRLMAIELAEERSGLSPS